MPLLESGGCTEQNKVALRKAAKAWRKQLEFDEVAGISSEIGKRFAELDLDWQQLVHVHVYRPIAENREIDPSHAVDQLRAQNPRVKIYFQDVVPIFPDMQFDVVIVPCIAADEQGNRIGYGGGNYDAFLEGQKSAVLIGLCYDQWLVASINHEPHDKPLDVVITESRIIQQ